MLILFVLSFMPLFLQAESKADLFVEFVTLSKKHKTDWINFCKEIDQKKAEIMKRHKIEWFENKVANINMWKDAKIASEQDKENIFHKQLAKAFEIRKRHDNEWKEFWDNFYKKGREIYEDHQKELTTFEDKFEPEKKEKVEAMRALEVSIKEEEDDDDD